MTKALLLAASAALLASCSTWDWRSTGRQWLEAACEKRADRSFPPRQEEIERCRTERSGSSPSNLGGQR